MTTVCTCGSPLYQHIINARKVQSHLLTEKFSSKSKELREFYKQNNITAMCCKLAISTTVFNFEIPYMNKPGTFSTN